MERNNSNRKFRQCIRIESKLLERVSEDRFGEYVHGEEKK